MKLSRILCFLCFSIYTQLFFAQTVDQPKGGLITGRIFAEVEESPIEFATISVYDLNSEELITGAISDKTGRFIIEIPNGVYRIVIESISFQSAVLTNIEISETEPVFNLKSIQLKMDVKMLKEIEVVAEQSTFQYSLDRKVFRVGKDIASSTGSVSELLDNIPSVQVDPNGRIGLRGSSSVKILIDGKPSALSSAKNLQNMPADMIEYVEVITNPSAKYDAEGLAGIINIISKKERKSGLHGALSLSTSAPQDHGIGLRLNRRRNKINLFSNVGVRYWNRPWEQEQITQYNLPDTTYFSNVSQNKTRRSISGDIHLGVDYFLNDRTIITSSFLYDLAHQPHEASLFYQDFNVNNVSISNEVRKNDELEIEYSLEYLLNYEQKFKKKGRELKGFLKYIDNGEDNHSVLSEYAANRNQEPINNAIKSQQTNLKEVDRNFMFQLDYVHPFQTNGKIEFGVKSDVRSIQNNFVARENKLGEWVEIGTLSNDFLYHESIYSVYGIVANQIKGFSYQLGMRVEQTHLKTELKQTNQKNDRAPFTDLFPSAHFGYQFENGIALQLNYSRRIQRPEFYHLNPFYSFTDDRFISVGNPDINSMYTNSYELGFLKSWDKTSFGISLYHRQTNNLIEEIITVNEESITFLTFQNINTKSTTGFEFYGEREFSSWLEVDASIDLIKSTINGENIEESLTVDYTNVSGRIGTTFKLPKKDRIQLRYSFRGARKNIQGRVRGLSRFDVSYRHELWAGKGALSFSIMDLFFTYKFKYNQGTQSIYTEGITIPWRPTFRANFRYRWGA